MDHKVLKFRYRGSYRIGLTTVAHSIRLLPNLLHLLGKHGTRAKIDIPEARKLLGL